MMTQSSKARLQRKRQYNAPAHTKRRMVSSHLSDDLREKYGRRSARVCKGDTVVIVRGNEDIKGIEGKVMDVATDTGRVTIDGITVNQADGTAVARPIHASNLVIVKLNLADEWRKDSLSKGKGAKQ
jgi:large subunit ribosomal protein L24